MRPGIDSGKNLSKMIRGYRELFNMVLDIICHAKEHRILRPEPEREEGQSGKGTRSSLRDTRSGSENMAILRC